VKFYFDNTLAAKIARGLHQFVQPEHAVVHVKDEFGTSVEDQHWFAELAKRSEEIVIVTADVRIERNPHQIHGWRETGHTIFFLKSGWIDIPFWLQAQKLTKCFPAILAAATNAEPAAAFLVSANGKIKDLH
jgi:hypothetical protein